jgi:hypothetical protein
MPSSRPHLFASGVLALGGGLLAVTALAIAVARVVVQAGLLGVVATTGDVELLGDLVAVLPFIVAVAVANLAAAVGLATGRAWAPRVGRWITGVTVATGLVGLVLLIVANGPVPASNVTQASDPEGFAILSVFVCLYAWAAIALRLPDDPRRPFAAGLAAGQAA